MSKHSKFKDLRSNQKKLLSNKFSAPLRMKCVFQTALPITCCIVRPGRWAQALILLCTEAEIPGLREYTQRSMLGWNYQVLLHIGMISAACQSTKLKSLFLGFHFSPGIQGFKQPPKPHHSNPQGQLCSARTRTVPMFFSPLPSFICCVVC